MAKRTRKLKGDVFLPGKVDPNSDLYISARHLTHQWCGSEQFVHLDVTERVARALVEAAQTGRLPDVPEGLDRPFKPGARVRVATPCPCGAFTK